MSILEEVSSMTGLPYDSVLLGFTAYLYTDSVLMVTNFKAILSYSDTKIIFKTKDNCFIVNGEDLHMVDIDDRQVKVLGHIFSIEYAR